MKIKFIAFGLLIVLLVVGLVGGFYVFLGYIAWRLVNPESFGGFILFVLLWGIFQYVASKIILLMAKLLRPYVPFIDRLMKKREDKNADNSEKQVSKLLSEQDAMFEEVLFSYYSKPETLTKLEQIVQNKSLDMECFGLILWAYNHYYPVTPLDSIPFMRTGGDGNHFVFITDFGQNADLEKAPIAMITPCDENTIQIVANNIKDFLAIIIYLGWSEVFYYYHYGEDLEALKRDVMKDHQDRLKQKSAYAALLQKQLDLPVFNAESLQTYMQQMKIQRQAQAPVPTINRLGVPGNPQNIRQVLEKDAMDPATVKSYLSQATKEEKMKFYRDFPYLINRLNGLGDLKPILSEAMTLHQDRFYMEAFILENVHK
jgi:hypothetical protein